MMQKAVSLVPWLTGPTPVSGPMPAPIDAIELVVEREPVPQGLRCKLTDALLRDPLLADDGYTYERTAWEAHVASGGEHLTSPQTQAPVSALAVPNRHLKNAAEEFVRHRDQVPASPASFSLEKWAEDPISNESMQEPVQLPDGMVLDVASARDGIFANAYHPGRSLLDQNMVFDASHVLRRDLNTLELSEAFQDLAPNTLPRDYAVPTVVSLLQAEPAAPGAVASPAAAAASEMRRRILLTVMGVGLTTFVGFAVGGIVTAVTNQYTPSPPPPPFG